MVVKQAQLDSVKGNFVLEKDTAYQEAVSYTHLDVYKRQISTGKGDSVQ